MIVTRIFLGLILIQLKEINGINEVPTQVSTTNPTSKVTPSTFEKNGILNKSKGKIKRKYVNGKDWSKKKYKKISIQTKKAMRNIKRNLKKIGNSYDKIQRKKAITKRNKHNVDNRVLRRTLLEKSIIGTVSLGFDIGKGILKIPAKVAKGLAPIVFDYFLRLPVNVASAIGVTAIITGLEFIPIKSTKKMIAKLKSDAQFNSWSTVYNGNKYTIATGTFGVRLYREKVGLFSRWRKSKRNKQINSKSNTQPQNTENKNVVPIPKRFMNFFKRFKRVKKPQN